MKPYYKPNGESILNLRLMQDIDKIEKEKKIKRIGGDQGSHRKILKQ